MKTLYGILGLSSEATAKQIEHAYFSFLSRLDGGGDGLSSSEIHNQKVALREAYSTLSNPILRLRYDEKLAAENLVASSMKRSDYSVEQPAGGLVNAKVIAVIGIFVLAGIYLYNEKVKEREQLRIKHEHEVKMQAIRLEESGQQHRASVDNAVLDMASSNAAAQQRRFEQQQFERDSAARERNELIRQQMAQQQQQRDQLRQLQQQREEANRQRQQQYEAQQRLASEKRQLQQIERERYGRAISY